MSNDQAVNELHEYAERCGYCTQVPVIDGKGVTRCPDCGFWVVINPKKARLTNLQAATLSLDLWNHIADNVDMPKLRSDILDEAPAGEAGTADE